jgi:RNA polymerase sigma factor (sigma-70 family)
LRYYHSLTLYAVGFIKDHEEARDLIMAIFEKLLANQYLVVPALNYSEKEVESYLRLVVKHRCLDFIKIKQGRTIIQDKVSTEISNQAVHKFDLEALQTAKSFLGKQQQKILELHLSGYSNEAISAKLKISYNTVKNTLVTSKKKVRNFWEAFMQ